MTSLTQSEEEKKLLYIFAESFREAEDFIKKAEVDTKNRYATDIVRISGVFLPAKDELRYAGCHISRYILLKSKKEPRKNLRDELTKAIEHCKRSKYDAIDCIIQFYLQECAQFQNDYKGIVIGDVITDYQNLKIDLNRISRLPLSRDLPNSEFDQQSDSDCNRVIEIYDQLDAARDELNKKIKKERYEILKWVCGTIIMGLLTIIIRIIFSS